MNAETIKLRNPPIVEAVLDIDCEFLPNFQLREAEPAVRTLFEPTYPTFRPLFAHQLRVQVGATDNIPAPQIDIQAYQFLREEGRQLVQARQGGFSFNRLAPYSSLDDYLPEIERTWRLYLSLIPIAKVRAVRLRYINRLLLPNTEEGKVNLDVYLKIGPRSPDEKVLLLTGFTTQVSALETETGELVNLVLVAEPHAKDHLPVILDNTAARDIAVTRGIAAEGRLTVIEDALLAALEKGEWGQISSTIASLRRLKNRVFVNTLTPECLKMYE
jgi:uncharacterized protein (TIGR04255 family)